MMAGPAGITTINSSAQIGYTYNKCSWAAIREDLQITATLIQTCMKAAKKSNRDVQQQGIASPIIPRVPDASPQTASTNTPALDARAPTPCSGNAIALVHRLIRGKTLHTLPNNQNSLPTPVKAGVIRQKNEQGKL